MLKLAGRCRGGQRARVLDLLGAVGVRPAVEHATRTEPFPERGIRRVVRVLRLFFGVQVVEVAEELVEAVDGRQEVVAIAEMILFVVSRVVKHFGVSPAVTILPALSLVA
jgi:hypothetical protein